MPKKKRMCPFCNGTGQDPITFLACDHCVGTGETNK